MYYLIIFTCLCFGSVTSNLLPVVFQALSPRGLKLTLQDNGFSSFAITANLRRGSQTKQWQVFIPRAINGYWSSIDRDFYLQLGDVIYYNVLVIKNNQQIQEYGSWVVNEFVTNIDDMDCDISETTTPCASKICKNTLIFNQEFNDDDLSKWRKEVIFPQEPEYPFNAYVEEAIRVENGNLIIKPELPELLEGLEWDLGSSCTGEFGTRECVQMPIGAQILPPVTSGKLSTKSYFSFKFGRIDIRAKLPKGEWLVPEIHLEPLYHEYGKQHYASGLVRIAFVRGNREFSNVLYGGIMIHDTEPQRSILLSKLYHDTDWNDDFHVYSVIWRPSGIQMIVDNVTYGTINDSDNIDITNNLTALPHKDSWERGSSAAPIDQMFYISLGVRVGGINDFADSPLKPWKNSSSKAMYKFWTSTLSWSSTWTSPELIVDYVRVYSL